jgi:hypothetical protein
MGGFGFNFLPQMFGRVVIRRIGGQLVDRELIRMFCEKAACLSAGVIPGPILDQDHRAGDLLQQTGQKDLVGDAVEAFITIQPVEASRKELDQPKDFLAFAQSAGLDLRLTTFWRPGIGKRAPLGKTHLIFRENRASFPLGLGQQGGPHRLDPGFARGFIQMIRHNA